MPGMETQGKIKLRKNDTVKIIAGRDKGKSGRI
ncbi:MAG: KOW motif-containing protein, partial [Spirochaetia bacterium]